MNKLIPLALLTLLPFAAACPVKKGYIANGIVKDVLKPSEFVPLCEMKSAIQSQFFSSMKWTEVYGVQNNQKGAINIAYIQAALKEKGFKQTASQKTEKGNIWRYDKGRQTIMMMIAINDPLVFVAIGGR